MLLNNVKFTNKPVLYPKKKSTIHLSVKKKLSLQLEMKSADNYFIIQIYTCQGQTLSDQSIVLIYKASYGSRMIAMI